MLGSTTGGKAGASLPQRDTPGTALLHLVMAGVPVGCVEEPRKRQRPPGVRMLLEEWVQQCL